jgi:hypothetical protein
MSMAVLVFVVVAAVRVGHGCQHARARPLQHITNNQRPALA